MKTRIFSAIGGVAIALLVLFFHNTLLLPIAIAAVTCIMLYEFLHVMDLLPFRLSSIAVLLYGLLLPFCTVGAFGKFRPMLLVTCTTIILLDFVRHKTHMSSRSFFILLGAMYLIPGAMCTAILLNHSHEQHGVIYLVLALAGAWLADSGAYFVGSAIGKHKLCPEVSPKKTIEGFIGGIVVDILFFVLFSLIYSKILAHNGTPIAVHWLSVAIIGGLCGVLGTVGDLTASVIKRQQNIKDFGKIMPGHGGLLDRFDSVLLVMPFFYAYISATGFFSI